MKVLVVLFIVAAAAALGAALPSNYAEEPSADQLDDADRQAAEYADAMAMYARKEADDPVAADEPAVKPAVKPAVSPPVQETDPVKQTNPFPTPLEAINLLLTSFNLPNLPAAAAANGTAIAQALVTTAQTMLANIAMLQNQANLNGLALFNNVTTSLLNLPNPFRLPATQPAVLQPPSSDEALAAFKKIATDSPTEQQIKPLIFIPARRPADYYGYPFAGSYASPYHSFYPQPYGYPGYHHQAAPFSYFRGHPSHPQQFRRPANPTADDLSDLEALAHLESLLASKAGHADEDYREAEARGLLSSLTTGANTVRTGFKNIYNSIQAALPTVVYKTLVVPSLASGSAAAAAASPASDAPADAESAGSSSA